MATNKLPTETWEQIKFVEWFKKTYPDVIIIYIHNGGTRSLIERVQQRCLGLHPGTSDLFVPEFKLWIEMKRTKLSRVSDEQKVFMKDMHKIGYQYIIGYGWEDAKSQVLEMQLGEIK